MEFRVKKINISAGDALVAVLNVYDATRYDLHSMDRISVTNDKNESITVVIDISNSENIVSNGTIGLFDEVIKHLKIKGDKKVRIHVEKKPDSINLIKKKLKGHKLSYDEFKGILYDIGKNNLTDIEMTYFVAGNYVNGLTTKETYDLTRAMIDTGEILEFPQKIVIDKHCIGGVAGNRTTALVVAIITAAGYTMPKTSSRAITSASGTADTMEQLCRVDLSSDELKKSVEKTGGCLAWGGALNLAPSDDKIIRVESPLSLDPIGQLIASVLAKKKSVSATHVLIDIPVGRGAKIKDDKKAKMLKKKFQKISKMLKLKAKVIITDGSHPIGHGIGPQLEARDILYTLRNDLWGSWELKEKSIYLSGILLKMVGHRDGEEMARKIFDSGKAYKKFIEIIKSQGGKEIDPDMMKLGKYKFDYYSPKTGHITHIDNKIINRLCRIAGSPLDPLSGIYLYINKGKFVRTGDKIFTIYSDSMERMQFAKDHVRKEHGIEID